MGEIDEVKLRPVESIGALCLSEHMADVHFICNNNVGSISDRIAGHKFYLGMVCPTLHTEFFGPMAEQSDVKVADYGITADAFKLMLKYLYCSDIHMDRETAWQLLYLGKKYLLRPLQDLCTAFIVDQLQHYTPWCLHLLQQLYGPLADTDSLIMHRVLELIDENGERAVTSDLFLDLNEEVLALLLHRNTLDVDEVTLYRMVIQWSERECDRVGVSVTEHNRRAVLHNILPLIRFTAVSDNDLQLMIRVCPILSDDDIASIANRAQQSHLPFSAQPRGLTEKQIYIIGGLVNGSVSGSVYTYSVQSGSQPMPMQVNTPRRGHCTAYSQQSKQLFVVGGLDQHRECPPPEVCSFVTGADTTFAGFESTKVERVSAACICIGSRLFVMAGSNESDKGTECEMYDMQLGTWTHMAHLPIDGHLLGARCVLYEEAAKETILLIGGFREGDDGAVIPLKSVLQYLPECDQWRDRVDLALPIQLGGCAAVVYNGEVVIIGGTKSFIPRVPTGECYRLDRDTDSTPAWASLPPLNTARYSHQAVVLHGKIVVMGGIDHQHHVLQSVEVFDGEQWTYALDFHATIADFAALVI